VASTSIWKLDPLSVFTETFISPRRRLQVELEEEKSVIQRSMRARARERKWACRRRPGEVGFGEWAVAAGGI
jgi:hypothetical protein